MPTSNAECLTNLDHVPLTHIQHLHSEYTSTFGTSTTEDQPVIEYVQLTGTGYQHYRPRAICSLRSLACIRAIHAVGFSFPTRPLVRFSYSFSSRAKGIYWRSEDSNLDPWCLRLWECLWAPMCLGGTPKAGTSVLPLDHIPSALQQTRKAGCNKYSRVTASEDCPKTK